MSNISKIKVSGVEYDIKDIQAREDLGNLGTRVTELEQHGGGSGSTVELDTTLSEAGKAADAKAVGDALAGKQNTISDLEAIRTGAAKGATALQSVPSTYRTAEAQDVIDSGKQDKLIAGENITIAEDGKTISASGLEPPIKTGSLLRGDADNGKWSEVNADGGYGYTDGQKTVIEWDGNVNGKAEVYFTGEYYYNVSEKVPSLEELNGGIAVGSTETMPLTISSDNCAAMGGIISIIDIYKDLSILVVPNDNFHFEYSAGEYFIEADFPKKGVYFAKRPDSTIDFVHSLTYGNEIVHQIAEKYLPEVVRSGAKEIILSSSTAGSTKKFKITVDDSGTLSATEVTA